jgi:hypothetical protein
MTVTRVVFSYDRLTGLSGSGRALALP